MHRKRAAFSENLSGCVVRRALLRICDILDEVVAATAQYWPHRHERFLLPVPSVQAVVDDDVEWTQLSGQLRQKRRVALVAV